MKFFLVFILVLIQSQVHAYSIRPDRIVTQLIDIFNTSNTPVDEEIMRVSVRTFNDEGEISLSTKEFDMSHNLFQLAKDQSSAVFQMFKETPDMEFHGTAFHIGENLVLTNQHVLSPDRTNTTKCDGFKLLGNETNDEFSCKKVHYCHIEEDICLIEMNPAKRCENFFCTRSNLFEMKNNPKLKLKSEPKLQASDTITMTSIGNTQGLGIHYSQGNGVLINKNRIYFFSPIRDGNSGGPLIGDDGLVWGVIKLESLEKVGENTYNIAAPINKVIEYIRKNVTDTNILEKFNKAIKD